MAPLSTESSETKHSIINGNEELYKSMQHKRQRLFPIETSEQWESAYDEVLYNASQSMTPIRRWEKRMGFVTPILWKNVMFISAFHIVTVVWFLHDVLTLQAPKWQTVLFGMLEIHKSLQLVNT